jgi:hypothetical protein
MVEFDDNMPDKAALTEEQNREIEVILAQYARKTMSANEMEWQVRRIKQLNWYSNRLIA